MSRRPTTVKILNFNTWLLKGLAEDIDDRLAAIGEVLKTGDFDVVLLQEVWFEEHHANLSASLPYFTTFERLNGPDCRAAFFGQLADKCSGLMILSRFPISKTNFREFSVRDVYDVPNYGALEVGRGIGMARIEVKKSVKIDFFNAHLDPFNDTRRIIQSRETFSYIKNFRSKAKVAVLTGDLNDIPGSKSYAIVAERLTDSLLEVYPDSSLDEDFATFAFRGNTYSADGEYPPQRIDYIMYGKKDRRLKVQTLSYESPRFSEYNNGKSISDHEAVAVTLKISR